MRDLARIRLRDLLYEEVKIDEIIAREVARRFSSPVNSIIVWRARRAQKCKVKVYIEGKMLSEVADGNAMR